MLPVSLWKIFMFLWNYGSMWAGVIEHQATVCGPSTKYYLRHFPPLLQETLSSNTYIIIPSARIH